MNKASQLPALNVEIWRPNREKLHVYGANLDTNEVLKTLSWEDRFFSDTALVEYKDGARLEWIELPINRTTEDISEMYSSEEFFFEYKKLLVNTERRRIFLETLESHINSLISISESLWTDSFGIDSELRSMWFYTSFEEAKFINKNISEEILTWELYAPIEDIDAQIILSKDIIENLDNKCLPNIAHLCHDIYIKMKNTLSWETQEKFRSIFNFFSQFYQE